MDVTFDYEYLAMNLEGLRLELLTLILSKESIILDIEIRKCAMNVGARFLTSLSCTEYSNDRHRRSQMLL